MSKTLPHSALQVYAEELRRWNRSFSLVSRQDQDERIDTLIYESWNSARTIAPVLTQLLEGRQCTYIDLGSGGGFPGLVWTLSFLVSSPHTALSGAHLIEPRGKRAWFLDRAARVMGLDTIHVHQWPWESTPTSRQTGLPGGTDMVLVSLKALAMTDDVIRSGLKRNKLKSENDLLVARFHKGGCEVDRREFGLPPQCIDSLTGIKSPGWTVMPYEYADRKDQLILSYYPI